MYKIWRHHLRCNWIKENLQNKMNGRGQILLLLSVYELGKWK